MLEDNITLEMIKKLNDRLIKESNGYIRSFQEIKTFNLGEINNIIVDNHRKKCGIYFFEIKFNGLVLDEEEIYDRLKIEWEKDLRVHIPKIIKNMVSKNDFSNEDTWIPFYLGKSNDMGVRFEEHLIGKSSTSGLRLSEIKSGLFLNASYRLNAIELDGYKGDNYWVVTKIEKILREKMSPICGR